MTALSSPPGLDMGPSGEKRVEFLLPSSLCPASSVLPAKGMALQRVGEGTGTQRVQAPPLGTAHIERHKLPRPGLLASPQPLPATSLCWPWVLPIGATVQAPWVTLSRRSDERWP